MWALGFRVIQGSIKGLTIGVIGDARSSEPKPQAPNPKPQTLNPRGVIRRDSRSLDYGSSELHAGRRWASISALPRMLESMLPDSTGLEF